ncbi:hypothetical protein HDU92_003857 [Lobulomyces angularis]|nr:hypothetical protein HDU92_003857 [Lobulomyces angularis]
MECKDGVCYLDFSKNKEVSNKVNGKEYVENLIKCSKVVIFSKSYCLYCTKAKTMFKKLGVPFEAPELNKVEGGEEIHNYVKEKTQEATVPNIFIGGEWLGGWDDLKEEEKNGKLTIRLKNVHLIN